MITDEELDRLAGILYEAYQEERDAWEDLKRDYPCLVHVWHRVADAAVRNVVVVKIGTPD